MEKNKKHCKHMCNISRGEVSVDSRGEQLCSVKVQLQNESGKHEPKTAEKHLNYKSVLG